MPFSKHKQIDRLAPAAAYDIYTTCMIQHTSLGKQACVLSILVLFQTAFFQGERMWQRECNALAVVLPWSHYLS